jgi:hypothetical protein
VDALVGAGRDGKQVEAKKLCYLTTEDSVSNHIDIFYITCAKKSYKNSTIKVTFITSGENSLFSLSPWMDRTEDFHILSPDLLSQVPLKLDA